MEIILCEFTRVMFITNAFLDDECIEELNCFNVRYKVSLYGYNQESFRVYTGFQGEFDQNDYIEDILIKLRKLHHNSSNVTLNIPLSRKIVVGLGKLLKNEQFRKNVLDCGIEIKVIEMVKPRRGSEFFKEDYVKAIPAISKIGSVEEMDEEIREFSNTQKYNIDGMYITIYKYPCNNTENCKTCFNNFALTMKPDGHMMICQKALRHNSIGNRIFSRSNIEIEDVDLGKEYSG